jgi:LDH2 family malate/lactate/ureidoglycolate dehydrogenase
MQGCRCALLCWQSVRVKRELRLPSLITAFSLAPPLSLSPSLSQTAAAMRALGWSASDAETQAEIMLYAELRGSNQGLTKLQQPESMAPTPTAATGGGPAVVKDTLVSALVDGNQSPGMLACTRCCDIAVEKCKQGPGIALVSSFNTKTSSGMLAY